MPSRRAHLKRLHRHVERALKDYESNGEWKDIDAALTAMIAPFDNYHLSYVVPKVVALDRMYSCFLIRFLPAPEQGMPDLRFLKYYELASEISTLGLDGMIPDLRTYP